MMSDNSSTLNHLSLSSPKLQKKEVVKHNSIEFILLLGKSGLLSFRVRGAGKKNS